jgi:hypothetical protein
MKKLITFFSFLLISVSGFSQTYVMEEFFDDTLTFPPANWTMIDADGDTYNWRMNSWDNGTFLEVYAVSDSWLSGGIGALTPENYLVTPQINLTSATGVVRLRYTVQVADQDYYEEKYKVAVSTTGNAVADFTNVVFTETLDTSVYYVWKERILDLTPFIGQQIYLTFCHFDCTDMYKLLLDSVQVYYGPNTGVTEYSAFEVTVAPNPATHNLIVNGEFDNASLRMFTMDGRLVYSAADVTRYLNIDVSDFSRGMYLVEIESSKGKTTRKIALTD